MSSPVMTETLMLEKTLKTSKLERKVTSTNIQVHKFSTLESLMIIHLSCTTVQKPSPKMARTLLIDLTAVTLHFQIQSASLRLMSTNCKKSCNQCGCSDSATYADRCPTWATQYC